MTGWEQVAAEFHERVRANCWDSLAGQLLNLHQPHVRDGQPTCEGCDRDERGTTDPVWPCRTYTLIASTLLNVADIEGILTSLLARAKGCRPPQKSPVLTNSSATAPDQSVPPQTRTGRTRSGQRPRN